MIASVLVPIEQSAVVDGTSVVNALEHAAKLGHCLSLGQRTVQVEQQIAEAYAHETTLHHIEGGALLGNEEDALALGDKLGDEVADRLAFARTRRPGDHDAVARIEGWIAIPTSGRLDMLPRVADAR